MRRSATAHKIPFCSGLNWSFHVKCACATNVKRLFMHVASVQAIYGLLTCTRIVEGNRMILETLIFIQCKLVEKLLWKASIVVFTDAHSFPPSHHGFQPAGPSSPTICFRKGVLYVWCMKVELARFKRDRVTPLRSATSDPIGGLLPLVTPCLRELSPKVQFLTGYWPPCHPR